MEYYDKVMTMSLNKLNKGMTSYIFQIHCYADNKSIPLKHSLKKAES